MLNKKVSFEINFLAKYKLPVLHCFPKVGSCYGSDFEDWYRMYPNKEAKNPLEMTSDKNVQDDLKAFYKAKEQIYNHK